MIASFRPSLLATALCLVPAALAADPVFSGPQPSETTSAFKVLSLPRDGASLERDPIAENKGGAITLVFLHALERSLVPLLKVVDEYGADRKDHLRTEIIFLADDKISGEQRMKAASGSLKLKSNIGLSLDGSEGPGNYGLNKECMMTIVIAKDNKVTANFALVQPGIADAPKVLQALAKVSGDTNPPTVESLAQRRPQGEMRARPQAQMKAPTEPEKEKFPGAVPTDEKLVSLLRQFIRPTNDNQTVDRVLGEVKSHIKDNPELKQQAIDGWTRVLHFGDRYGSPYARKVGAEFLASLKEK
jgi:hypothetical protein